MNKQIRDFLGKHFSSFLLGNDKEIKYEYEKYGRIIKCLEIEDTKLTLGLVFIRTS